MSRRCLSTHGQPKGRSFCALCMRASSICVSRISTYHDACLRKEDPPPQRRRYIIHSLDKKSLVAPCGFLAQKPATQSQHRPMLADVVHVCLPAKSGRLMLSCWTKANATGKCWLGQGNGNREQMSGTGNQSVKQRCRRASMPLSRL